MEMQAAMEILMEMQEAEADIMAIVTAAGPMLLEELRAGSAYMQAKSKAAAHFKGGERALALDACKACHQILMSNPLLHEAKSNPLPPEGDAALKALGAENGQGELKLFDAIPRDWPARSCNRSRRSRYRALPVLAEGSRAAWQSAGGRRAARQGRAGVCHGSVARGAAEAASR